MKSFKNIVEFLRNKKGNFAITTAILAAPALGAVALGIDYTLIHQKRSQLQDAADSAALASTKELGISSITQDEINAIANSYANSNFDLNNNESLKVKAILSKTGESVDVSLSYYWKPFFAHLFDKTALPLVATSSATVATSGSTSICVLTLNKTNPKSLYMNKKSSMSAPGCGIYANSKDTNALEIDKKSKMSASAIMVAGGYQKFSEENYSPKPLTDVPQIEDPLADRSPPVFSNKCDHENLSVTVDTTLSPGTYCGGLHIGDDAVATLESGEYIMKGGDLAVQGNATIQGEHVGFYFNGPGSTFDFGVSTQAILTAPKKGNMAGILFFEDRDTKNQQTYTIRSKDAEKFEGVIYLPKGRLFIDKSSRVGQTSKWTAFVVDTLDIGMGPQLEIKSDYSGSDVPVPGGIKEGPAIVRLTN